MSRATTITLANTLMDNLGDTTQLGQFYDDIVFELGRGLFPGVVSLTGAGFVAGVGGTATYSFPSTAIRVLGVCYDANQLAEAGPAEADFFDVYWRRTRGRPVSFATADEDQRIVRLLPIPAHDGNTIVGTPFTWTTWPSENLTFIYTENRADVHLDEELAIALEMCAREYSRDSNHHDMAAAQVARQLSKLFMALSHTR